MTRAATSSRAQPISLGGRERALSVFPRCHCHPTWDIVHRAFWWPPELGAKAPLRPLRNPGEKHGAPGLVQAQAPRLEAPLPAKRRYRASSFPWGVVPLTWAAALAQPHSLGMGAGPTLEAGAQGRCQQDIWSRLCAASGSQ